MSEHNNQNPWEQQNDKQPDPVGQQPETPEQTQEQIAQAREFVKNHRKQD